LHITVWYIRAEKDCAAVAGQALGKEPIRISFLGKTDAWIGCVLE
jgi:hypothetical protein